MPRKNRIGYDIIETYTEDEVLGMYRLEGLDGEPAKQLAHTVSLTLNNMVAKERRFWKEVRSNEMIVGLDPEYIEEYTYA